MFPCRRPVVSPPGAALHYRHSPTDIRLPVCKTFSNPTRYPSSSYKFFFGATTPSGPEPLHPRGFYVAHNDASQSVGLLWTSDQIVADTPTWQHTTLNRQTSMPPVGFGLTISTGELPPTYALHRAATGTCKFLYVPLLIDVVQVAACVHAVKPVTDHIGTKQNSFVLKH